MSEKKIFLLSMTLFLLLLAAIALPTYVILNHKTTFKGLLSSVPEREYNAIIAKTQDYNAVILGSSMSECFKCSELDEVMKCNSLKLTINGCNFAEAGFMADYAAKYRKLDLVMLDFHILMFAPNFNISSEHDLKNMPMEHYGDNAHLIPLKKAFSITGIAEAAGFVKDYKKGRVKSISRDELYDWSKKRSWGEKYFARDVLYNPTPDMVIDDLFLERTRNNISKHLIPMFKQYPDTKFILFFPPNSMMQYRKIEPASFIKLKGMTIDMLLPYKNVFLYDFQAAFHITENFNNYKDREHYSPQICSWLIHELGKKDYLLTAENKDDFLHKQLVRLKKYDFPKEFNRLKKQNGGR